MSDSYSVRTWMMNQPPPFEMNPTNVMLLGRVQFPPKRKIRSYELLIIVISFLSHLSLQATY